MFQLNRFSLTLLMLFLMVSSAGAQRERERMSNEEREKMRENMQTFRMFRLIEVLDLSEEQSTVFLPVLKDFQKAQDKLFQERRDLIDELHKALRDQKEARVREILENLKQNQKMREETRWQFIMKSEKMLDLGQQAKMVLFEERFQEEMLDRVREMREMKEKRPSRP